MTVKYVSFPFVNRVDVSMTRITVCSLVQQAKKLTESVASWSNLVGQLKRKWILLKVVRCLILMLHAVACDVIAMTMM
jgi:hypothetical protein